MGLKMNNNIAIYNNGEIELKVSVENETVWLNCRKFCDSSKRGWKRGKKWFAFSKFDVGAVEMLGRL